MSGAAQRPLLADEHADRCWAECAARESGSQVVVAWSLREGDLLPGGETVLAVHRNPYADEVLFVTDDGERRLTGRTARIVVLWRDAEDGGGTDLASRSAAFVAAVRHARTGRPPDRVDRSRSG
jgi:hypothetical protein